jgi:hypothetical protein
MRLPEISLLIASLGLSACVVSSSSQQPPSKWTTGFWFWEGSSTDAPWSGEPLDALFVHVGIIRKGTLPPFTRTATDADEQWHADICRTTCRHRSVTKLTKMWTFVYKHIPNRRVDIALSAAIVKSRRALRTGSAPDGKLPAGNHRQFRCYCPLAPV